MSPPSPTPSATPPSSTSSAPLLAVEALSVSYGGLSALTDASIRVDRGELVALVGANGAGKSTLLNAVARLIPSTSGSIRFEGDLLGALGPHEVVGRGIATVPEGRRLFGQMTVEENLELGAYSKRARKQTRTTLEEVYALLPRVHERRRLLASSLSGGEQQMVAIGRALMARPRLLMLDEPSLGLAPQVVDGILDALVKVNRLGMAVLLVEQNVHAALGLSQRAYVLDNGRVTSEGPSAQLLADPRITEAYLGPLGVQEGTS